MTAQPPPLIEPGRCPDGIVYQLWDLDVGQVVREHLIDADTADPAGLARSMAMAARSGRTLVGYDGDTGLLVLVAAAVPPDI